MKWNKWLEQWNMKSLKIKTPFLDMEWKPQDEDRIAAWELYTDLLTRITIQPLPTSYGDEKTVLASIYSIFPTTREVIKRNGRHFVEFTKIAIIVLNQIIRPFTAKWHHLGEKGSFKNSKHSDLFREELIGLQKN